MRTKGKYGKLWEKTRREWVKQNPSNHEGFYTCYICYRWVPSQEMELDHVLSRSRRPDLRYEADNLRPTCSVCNTQKGSREMVNPTNRNSGLSTDIRDILENY